jgi:hypothetical protein
MELIYFFLENYFILSSFYFFAGMGTGSNTGKLSFRRILSGDNSLNISEDSNGLTFSYISSTFSLDLFEIGYGKSGGGLTSSVFKAFGPLNSYTAIYGAKIWSKLLPTSQYLHTYNDSMVIGGCRVQMCGNFNLGIGGSYMYSRYSTDSILISGCINTSFCDESSTMIGGSGLYSRYSKFSVMLGGCTNQTYLSNCYSTIIGGYDSKFSGGYQNNFNTVITSNGRICGYRIRMSSIIGGSNKSEIINSNPLSSQFSDSNFILGGNSNVIYGGIAAQTLGSVNSSITGGSDNIVRDTFRSSIIGGNSNSISANFGYYSSIVSNSTILNGCNSGISTISYSSIECVFDSAIITSRYSCIYTNAAINPSGNVILGSRYANIFRSRFSLVSNSLNNPSICASDSSSIISSKYISMCSARNGLIFSSYNSNMNKSISSTINNSVIIGGYCGCLLGDESAIVGGFKNVITTGVNNFLTGGCENTVSSSSNSSILGGKCNFLSGTSSSIAGGSGNTSSNSFESNIISGSYNSICDSISSNISGGLRNYIIRGVSSNIVGGYLNKICKASGNVCNSAILGGCNISICDNNTTGVPDILYSSLSIVIAGTCYNGFTGTYSMAGTLYVRNGLITQS